MGIPQIIVIAVYMTTLFIYAELDERSQTSVLQILIREKAEKMGIKIESKK